ncbi:MAG: HK97 family phage prohead protease [Spirochaetaceae bacterium]|nr:HK97 family phage prohead protease [Spirochaetaceae bacterium]
MGRSDAERRCAELRTASGRRIVGAAMRYGAEARVVMPDGRPVTERFSTFAFSDYLRSGAGTSLNLMHDRSLEIANTRDGRLVLRESPAEVRMVATLPTGNAYDQALALVEDGSTSETSVEFVAQDEDLSGDRRIIRRATLPGIAIVDRGAYGAAGAVEVRQRGQGLGGSYRYNTPRVTTDRGRRRKVSFRSGAFKWQLQRFAELQEELGTLIHEAIDEGIERARESYEIQLLSGRSYNAPLASYRMGTLEIVDTDDALRFNVDRLPDTTYARDLRAGMEAGAADFGLDLLFDVPPREAIGGEEPAVIVPDPENPDVEIEEIRYGLLRAIAIVSRAPRGNGGFVERRGLVIPTTTERRRVWL